MRSNVATCSFVNIDPNTLELFIGNKRTAPMSIPLSDGNDLSDMTPMWNLTYYHFMYGVYGRRQQNLESGKRRAAQLSPPTAVARGAGGGNVGRHHSGGHVGRG